ncbi:WD repeat-containing protein 36 isoform X1 [Misgurnus anguillicaudatus]|uniref:WD repeat-containing protein 36 isoform X1 n=1 Tax=Misgurnus anguillicaudatus TaxID=75329 RepID=UPI002435F5EE|nr:WD repeat-containing protein 36 isoform X1 [Misgurnus anguillicaudatus]
MSTGRKGSVIFSGFRALGLYSNHLPHVVRFHKKHREFYVVTAVGQCFHTYNVKKLGIVAVSNSLPEDISCMAADRMLVYAAHGRTISAFAKNKEVVHTYTGHDGDVHLLLPFGDHLISVDKENVVIIWDVESEDTYLQISFEKGSFEVSAVMHPSTYLNKVLFGSSQGSLQLWNVKSNKLLYTFPGWTSAVTALQQTPAVDVVGVGLASGQIIIHNIRIDETLMKFQQDWGPVTALSFRTDGHPIMASGSPVGHIGLWDLEEKKLVSQMRDAHTTAIAGLTFLHSEPLLITNGADNAIRVWIFDVTGGDGRLLRHRMGHSAPPTKIRHHDQSGLHILSAGQDGTLQSFSTVHERFNKSLGHGSQNKKKAKKKGVAHDTAKLPTITTFASETARQSDWDGIIACHRGFLMATTWNYQKGSIGAHRLEPERFKKNRALSVHATAIDITSCGNFAVIALSSGHIDVFNMQSGLHRGHYGEDKAHAGPVRGVAVDGLNQLTVSVGADQLVKIWKFKSKELLHTHSLPAAPACSLLHRDSGMLAIALDDFTVNILDLETRRIVRRFSGNRGQINDMTFSPDGRWLITASMDCTIRTWDLPSGSLVDCFLVDAAAVSLSMSPTGNFLASSHVDGLGVYLWSNKTLCGMVSLRPLPADYEPTVIMLPGTCPSKDTDEEDTLDIDSSEMAEYVSPAQLDEQLITLSLLPDSRWKNLLHLDIIKKRNKPKEPPKLPKAAPFFIPTIPGLVPQFAVPDKTTEEQSKVVNLGVLSQKSTFYVQLENALDDNSYEEPVKLLKELGPSAIETELRVLSPEMGGDVRVMQSFLKMISSVLQSKRDFDLAQAWLALFLKLHLRLIAEHPDLMEEAESVSQQVKESWLSLQTLLHQNLCLLSYIKSALL